MRVVQRVHEGILLEQLNNLFPHVQKHVKARKQARILDPSSGAYLELDFLLPELDLSFEFQDPYHYVPIWYSQRSQSKIQLTDEAKKEIAEQKGSTLIQVPYWWLGDGESLKATISFYRPDLVSGVSDPPIPLNPVDPSFSDVPSVGQLMLASFPSVPNFSDTIVGGEWWLGEKYDGVRFCWDHLHHIVLSRTGRMLELLPAAVKHMPTNAVDGELWFGRGQYSYSAMLFSGSSAMVYWHMLKAVLFDIPSSDLENEPFETRYSCLMTSVRLNNPFANIAMRTQCEGPSHLLKMTREVIEAIGEGVILRKLGSIYEHGRSESLIKLKSFHGDKEGIVVELPSGKNRGVTLKLAKGTTFFVPSQDVHVSKIALGDIVSFSFDGHARRDVPVNPKIYKIRTDISWQDVVNSSRTDKYTTRPVSFWTVKNLRAFLEEFAKRNNKDPLAPETWYSSYKAVKEISSSVVRKFKGGYFAMLQKVFPEIEFDYSAFNQTLWKDISKRRKFFESYAKQNGFNPRSADSWLSQSIEKILSIKGSKGITSYYGNSVHKALLHLFPDIGLENLEQDPNKERQLFELYAKEKKFKPESAIHWHQQSRKDLVDKMGINIVVGRYGGVVKTLLRLFPNIGLEKLKFQFSYWSQVGNRRKFFEDYANKFGFNPQNPEKWYEAMPKLLATKDIDKVIMYYNNQLSQAMADLFPDIGFDKAILRKQYAVAKRRMFFERYAKNNWFDALNAEDWYSHSRDSILTAEGISKVIAHYENRVSKALYELFPEIGFDMLKYDIPAWRKAQDRKNFFINFATNNEFNPYCPDDWYLHPLNGIFTSQDGIQVLRYYDSNIGQALAELFPDIGIDMANFDPQVYWTQASNRKKVLLNYATENGFDAQNPENWYTQPISAIMATKHASKIVQYHQNIPKALLELFPEIGLDKRKFKMKFYSSSDKVGRKRFFETYAKRNQFDPLNPDQWYSRTNDILSTRGSKMVIYFHNNSVPKALVDLFPNIGLKRELFS